MKIFNKHDRIIHAAQDAVGRVLDSLSGPEDALWPREQWPPMLLDSALGVGAAGGHGPVRYRVSEYIPGRRAAFQFDKGVCWAAWTASTILRLYPGTGMSSFATCWKVTAI